MEKPESLADFYKNKFDWMPDNFKNEMGHFNVFTLEPFIGEKAKPIPYKRRDFYKISLAKGNSKVYFADQVVEVKKQALCFSNPQIPYKWEHLEEYRSGYFCIFNTHFFHNACWCTPSYNTIPLELYDRSCRNKYIRSKNNHFQH